MGRSPVSSLQPDPPRKGSGLPVLLFEGDAQAIRETVHEVEIRRHLDDLEDAPVVEAGVAQRLVVLPPHLVRLESELFGEGEDGAQTLIEVGRSPTLAERPDQIVVLRNQTERRPVMFDSVAAPVQRGYDHGNRLPVGPG